MENQIYTFHLPDIGEGVVEGEVVEWLKQVGDSVKKDEPVVVVMTDKATVELPAPYAGIISKHYCQAGHLAFKDKPLYDISVDASITLISAKEFTPKSSETFSEAPKECIDRKSQVTALSSQKQGKALATPQVRHLAKEMDIDIESITGSGKDGRVVLGDLKREVVTEAKVTISAPIWQLAGDEVRPLLGVRGVMARRMDQLHIPQFSYFEQVDVSRLIQLQQNIKGSAAEQGINFSYMPLFIRALSLVAKKYPQINSSIDMAHNEMIFHQQHNVGIAMASKQGLIVPVLKGVQDMKFEEIILGYEDLKRRGQDNKFTASDMREATITISNFGSLGEGMWATPMVNAPEVAILAVARIRQIPVVRQSEIVVRDFLPLSWSFDHRVIDGELAAKISHDYCTLLKDPAALL